MSVIAPNSSSAAAFEDVNFHFAQNLLNTSVSLSQNIYAYTGISCEFIEAKALQVSTVSAQIATSLDARVNTTLSAVKRTRKSVQDKTKQSLVSLAENSVVVRKADSVTNNVLSEVERQIESLQQSVRDRYGVQKCLLYLEDGQEVSSDEQQNHPSYLQRAQLVIYKLNAIGKLLAESYVEDAKKYTVVNTALTTYERVAQQGSIVQANVISALEVFYTFVVIERLFNPLFNSLQVHYSRSKDTVTVAIKNIKKQVVDELLATGGEIYTSLKQATIASYKQQQLNFVFLKGFFDTEYKRIQSDLTQLLTDVSAKTTELFESAKTLYAMAVEEFKKKRSVRLQLKAEADSDQLTSSGENEEEEAHQQVESQLSE